MYYCYFLVIWRACLLFFAVPFRLPCSSARCRHRVPGRLALVRLVRLHGRVGRVQSRIPFSLHQSVAQDASGLPARQSRVGLSKGAAQTFSAVGSRLCIVCHADVFDVSIHVVWFFSPHLFACSVWPLMLFCKGHCERVQQKFAARACHAARFALYMYI